MNKYSYFSLTTVVIFIILFSALWRGVSFGLLGKPFIISMFLFPLFGAILGLKAKKGLIKWLLIILNICAFFTIGYIILLAFGIAEN
ncbi:hypothetical protein [Bacillus toyonensis]|uniref:hypothetical protein n=1 Tax=Bacillus toyonensis TaxID=155322 RepID=UPI002E21CA01|nr:hypothetical protein [Bacillus toyonensis]